MLEEDRVAFAQIDVGDWHYGAVDLEDDRPERDLGQVSQTGCLAPSRVGDGVPHVDRSPAALAGGGRCWALRPAPAAGQSLIDVAHRPHAKRRRRPRAPIVRSDIGGLSCEVPCCATRATRSLDYAAMSSAWPRAR